MSLFWKKKRQTVAVIGADGLIASLSPRCRACREPMKEGAVKCSVCGMRQDLWRALDFAPGITAGIGALISALTFSAVVIHSLTGERSRVSIPWVTLQNDEVSVVVANTGRRPALLQSVGLVCGVNGIEEADFYPEGASASQAIILKQEEVTQLSINTTKNAAVGSMGPDRELEVLSTSLWKDVDKVSGSVCAVLVLVVESDGEVRRVYSYPGGVPIMVALQRIVAREDKLPDFQILSLNGALIGQYQRVNRFLFPENLKKFLDHVKKKS